MRNDEDFDEKEYQKFMEWCDRKIAEKEAKRRGERGQADVVSVGQSGGSVTSQSHPFGPTPASLTNDPRHQETF